MPFFLASILFSYILSKPLTSEWHYYLWKKKYFTSIWFPFNYLVSDLLSIIHHTDMLHVQFLLFSFVLNVMIVMIWMLKRIFTWPMTTIYSSGVSNLFSYTSALSLNATSIFSSITIDGDLISDDTLSIPFMIFFYCLDIADRINLLTIAFTPLSFSDMI